MTALDHRLDRHERRQVASQEALEHETRIDELEATIRKDKREIARLGVDLHRLSLRGYSVDSERYDTTLRNLLDAAKRVVENEDDADETRQKLADAQEAS